MNVHLIDSDADPSVLCVPPRDARDSLSEAVHQLADEGGDFNVVLTRCDCAADRPVTPA